MTRLPGSRDPAIPGDFEVEHLLKLGFVQDQAFHAVVEQYRRQFG